MSPQTEKHGHEEALPLPDPDAVQKAAARVVSRLKERRGYYLSWGVLVIALVVAITLYRNRTPSQAPSDFLSIWTYCEPIRERLARDQSAAEYIDKLEQHVASLGGSPQEGYGLWYVGLFRMREAWTPEKLTAQDQVPHLEKAIAALTKLRDLPGDVLLAKTGWFTGDRASPVESALAQAKSDLEWVKKASMTPPKPAEDLVAVLRTELGDLYLQFYSDLAPEHVKNFVTLAKSGAYNGTKFHYLSGGRSQTTGIVGGDPFSFFYPDPLKNEHLLRWGSGGAGYDVPPEEARFKVVHQRGVVSAQRRGSRDASKSDWDDGMQFQILLKSDRKRDRVFTPFAIVVEGIEVADKIAARKTAGESDRLKSSPEFTSVETRDLFVEPVTLQKVLIYRNGALEEGHAFEIAETEKKTTTLKNAPVAPLPEDKLLGERRLRETDAAGDPRLGLDFPFPADLDVKKVRESGKKPELGERP